MVGTLALARVPVDSDELADGTVQPWEATPYRMPNVHMDGRGGWSVGIAELLSAFFPGTASVWAKFTAAGVTFEATGLPR